MPVSRDKNEATELFEAWRRGDRAAGARLFERHLGQVHRFFVARVGQYAEDLTQQTFLACEESKDRVRGACSFRTFIFAVARHVLGKHCRHQRRHGARIDPYDGVLSDPSPSNSGVLAIIEEQRLLCSALMTIPEELRRVVRLYYWDHHTSAEIAECLGIPHGTIRTRLRRARNLLRRELTRSSPLR